MEIHIYSRNTVIEHFMVSRARFAVLCLYYLFVIYLYKTT